MELLASSTLHSQVVARTSPLLVQPRLFLGLLLPHQKKPAKQSSSAEADLGEEFENGRYDDNPDKLNSNVFPLPDYQANAVRTWFAEHPPPYGADRFNNSQQTKGIPDVSANGANYVIAIDGEFSLVFGTSASSPTFGSIVTLINEARIAARKSSVGFINPTLYAHPNVLNGKDSLPSSGY